MVAHRLNNNYNKLIIVKSMRLLHYIVLPDLFVVYCTYIPV